MKIKVGILSFIFLFAFVTMANAGAYFRASGVLSMDNSHDIDQEFQELDIDPDDPGFGISGALGYKPNSRSQSGFVGEVEVQYSESDGDFEYAEGEDVYNIESQMHFVTVFFNVGYDIALSSLTIKERPVLLQPFIGAGPVFSGLHGEVRGGESINLDHVDGDTAIGWQSGARLKIPLAANVDLGVGVKYIDYGDHKATPNYEFTNKAVEGDVGLILYF